MSDNLCSLCGTKTPTFVCFCTETPVCQSCISQHLLNAPDLPHKPVAITSRELLHFLRAEAKIDPAERSKQPYREHLERELQQVTAAKAQALLDLANLQEELENQVRTAVAELRSALVTAADRLEAALRRKAAEVDDPAVPPSEIPRPSQTCASVQISLESRNVDLTALVKGAFKASFELREGSGNVRRCPTVLYKLFGGSNCIGVFDGAKEKVGKNLSANLRFFHNSCYCDGPNGCVFVTGGSQTGNSRNEAFSLHLTTALVSEISAMQIARRCHASICVGKWLYVFGGILDDDRLSLCERYSIEADTWQSIAAMNERRAYLGSCEFEGKIYVAGGSNVSPCEVYNPADDSFTLLPAPHICIEDNCSIISLATSILLFHGAFQGVVTRLDPASGRFTQEKDMCVGNSWSSTPPIRVNNYVYLLRAESVFKYKCDTGESEYVARLAKGRHRALD